MSDERRFSLSNLDYVDSVPTGVSFHGGDVFNAISDVVKRRSDQLTKEAYLVLSDFELQGEFYIKKISEYVEMYLSTSLKSQENYEKYKRIADIALGELKPFVLDFYQSVLVDCSELISQTDIQNEALRYLKFRLKAAEDMYFRLNDRDLDVTYVDGEKEAFVFQKMEDVLDSEVFDIGQVPLSNEFNELISFYQKDLLAYVDRLRSSVSEFDFLEGRFFDFISRDDVLEKVALKVLTTVVYFINSSMTPLAKISRDDKVRLLRGALSIAFMEDFVTYLRGKFVLFHSVYETELCKSRLAGVLKELPLHVVKFLDSVEFLDKESLKSWVSDDIERAEQNRQEFFAFAFSLDVVRKAYKGGQFSLNEISSRLNSISSVDENMNVFFSDGERVYVFYRGMDVEKFSAILKNVFLGVWSDVASEVNIVDLSFNLLNAVDSQFMSEVKDVLWAKHVFMPVVFDYLDADFERKFSKKNMMLVNGLSFNSSNIEKGVCAGVGASTRIFLDCLRSKYNLLKKSKIRGFDGVSGLRLSSVIARSRQAKYAKNVVLNIEQEANNIGAEIDKEQGEGDETNLICFSNKVNLETDESIGALTNATNVLNVVAEVSQNVSEALFEDYSFSFSHEGVDRFKLRSLYRDLDEIDSEFVTKYLKEYSLRAKRRFYFESLRENLSSDFERFSFNEVDLDAVDMALNQNMADEGVYSRINSILTKFNKSNYFDSVCDSIDAYYNSKNRIVFEGDIVTLMRYARNLYYSLSFSSVDSDLVSVFKDRLKTFILTNDVARSSKNTLGGEYVAKRYDFSKESFIVPRFNAIAGEAELLSYSVETAVASLDSIFKNSIINSDFMKASLFKDINIDEFLKEHLENKKPSSFKEKMMYLSVANESVVDLRDSLSHLDRRLDVEKKDSVQGDIDALREFLSFVEKFYSDLSFDYDSLGSSVVSPDFISDLFKTASNLFDRLQLNIITGGVLKTVDAAALRKKLSLLSGDDDVLCRDDRTPTFDMESIVAKDGGKGDVTPVFSFNDTTIPEAAGLRVLARFDDADRISGTWRRNSTTIPVSRSILN